MEALELEKDYVMKEMLSFADDILESWQDEICSGCGRTKKACQEAGGSGCDLR